MIVLYCISLFQVPSVPSSDNCIQWTGNGTAIIQVRFINQILCSECCADYSHNTTQSTLEYYGCNCCNDTKVFSLELNTRMQEDTGLQLTITVGYAGLMYKLTWWLMQQQSMCIWIALYPSLFVGVWCMHNMALSHMAVHSCRNPNKRMYQRYACENTFPQVLNISYV